MCRNSKPYVALRMLTLVFRENLEVIKDHFFKNKNFRVDKCCYLPVLCALKNSDNTGTGTPVLGLPINIIIENLRPLQKTCSFHRDNCGSIAEDAIYHKYYR